MSQHKRFSRDGFQPLTHTNSGEMANPNDVTIDIPMTKVTSQTGIRKTNTASPVATKQSSVEFSDNFDEKKGHSYFNRHTPAGRRRKVQAQAKENKDTDDGTLTTAGKIYEKIFNFSVVTRYFLYVAPVAACIAVPMIIGATAAPGARIGGVKLVWFFTWVEIVWVSLWVSKLVAQFLPYVFQFLCGVVSPGTRKYAAVITNLEIPLSLVGWAITSLATFAVLMTQNPDARAKNETSLKPWETVVKNILFACVFSTLVLLAEKFLIQLISISYHRKQFDEKIRDSKHNIYLVSLLYDASRNLFPPYCSEFAEEDYIMSDVLDMSSGKNSRASHRRSGSATPMRLIQGVGRVKNGVSSVFGHVAQEVTGKQLFNPNAAHSILVQALEKKHTTEALARRLWLSFVLEGRDALFPDDIAEVLGSEHHEEAEEAFYCLDADENGDISLDEMTLRLTEFGRDRMSITHSMRDVDQAITVLDNLLLTVVFVLVVLLFVAFLNRNFTTTLATTGTALLSLSFVFAATAQEVLGSCIFLFVKHPFDVGDRVDVNETQYVVEKISLLYTMFKCVKNHKRTQVPNIVLNSLWIDNVSRSKAMREIVLLYVHFDTSLEDVELLKAEMATFVKENPRDFQTEIDIEVTGIAEMNKLELKVEIKHKSNWANEAVRAARRSKFMCALVLALRKVPIYGPGAGGAPAGDKANPTYSVAITDGDARSNAKTFDEGKVKKRIDYSEKSDTPSAGKSSAVDYFKGSNVGGGEAKEQSAMNGLNKRDVASDPTRDHDLREDAVMENKRSNDIEEVRGILRKESTTGRRRANSTLASASRARFGAQTIPTIPDASPMEPVEPVQARSQPPRVSYFEDTPYVPVPAPLSPPRANRVAPQDASRASGPPENSSQGVNAHPLRADSATIPPSMVQIQAPTSSSNNPYYNKILPDQPSSEQLRTRDRSTTPTQSHKPVPGINEMKDYLISSPK